MARMGRQEKQQKQEKNGTPWRCLPAALVTLLAAALCTVLLLALRNGRGIAAGERSPETEALEAALTKTEGGREEKWQEGVITYQGKNYRYNQAIQTYLLMGVDKEGPAVAAEDGTDGGQSDAMFLVVMDTGKKELSVISINRNTMTKIKTIDKTGAGGGETTAQICTQHGFGDGLHLSSAKSAEAVSYLFYNIPISGYVSLHMDAMPKLNDAVGGVEVEILEDIKALDRGVDLKKGEEVLLTGDEAYCYLRSRDLNTFDSATGRLRRQEQFIAGFLKKLKVAVSGDAAKAAAIYDSVSEYLVTNADFPALVLELMDYEYEESRMYTVPGETVMGKQFEEYYPDEEALYGLILKVFYEEVEKEP